MKNPTAADSLRLWEEQQRTDQALAHLQRRELLKNFAIAFALIALTLTASTGIATWVYGMGIGRGAGL
jgi:hypothetical protein